MQNSLSPEQFKRVMPLPTWANNKWVPNVVLAKSEKAEAFYAADEVLANGIVKQSNFLKKKKMDQFGKEIIDVDTAAPTATTATGENKPTGPAGASVSFPDGDTAKAASGAVAADPVASSAGSGSPTKADSGAPTIGKDQAAKKRTIEKKDYGPIHDPVTGKINTAAIIAEQFGDRVPSDFGTYFPVGVVSDEGGADTGGACGVFTVKKNYSSKRFNDISMDALFFDMVSSCVCLCVSVCSPFPLFSLCHCRCNTNSTHSLTHSKWQTH